MFFVLFLLSGIIFSGCGGISKPTSFYLLTPIETGYNRKFKMPSDLTIGVGPVKISKYLERPQIITRSGKNRIGFSEFHHWAEDLEDNIENVISENLSIIYKTENIENFPWPTRTKIDYQLIFYLDRFEKTKNGRAAVSVRVKILYGKGRRKSLRYRIFENAAGNNYDSIVLALSKAIGKISMNVADEIKNIDDKKDESL